MEQDEQDPDSAPSLPRYVGDGIDELGRRYIVLSLKDQKLLPIPVDKVAKEEFFAILNDHGAHIYRKVTKEAVRRNIEQTPNELKFGVAAQMGWHPGPVFVLPDQVIGENTSTFVSALDYLDASLRSKYRASGSLKSWQQEILPLCLGNSLLIFTVCWAFASAVAALVDEAQKSGGAQLVGPLEAGKTTGAILAGSVWGCHVGDNSDRGFAESWNTTDNKVEETIAAHIHVGLILDETHLFTGDIAKTIMRLCEGSGKQRMQQGAAATFESFFLSTSNLPTWELIAGEKPSVVEAVLSRLCDIPLPKTGHGLFEKLHGFPHGAALSEAIKVRSREHFGTAGKAFLERLVEELSTKNGRAKCLTFIRDRREKYKKVLASRTEGMRVLERPADRFASAYAAGRLAAHYGILPWAWLEIREAILSCHIDAIRAAQPYLSAIPSKPTTPRSGMSKLREYVAKHARRFVDLDQTSLKLGTDEFGTAKGYRATFKRKKWYYFTADQLKQVVGGAAGYKSMCNDLVRKKLLDRSGNSITTQRPVYTGGKGNQNFARVVAIRRKAFVGPT